MTTHQPPQRRYLLVPRNPTTEERFEDYFDRLFRALANLRYCLFSFPSEPKLDYVEVFEGDPDYDWGSVLLSPQFAIKPFSFSVPKPE